MFKEINKFGKKLASPKWVFYILPLLILLLILGTVEQKNLGLYHATQIYFSSFYFTAFGIPFPGGYSLIALLSITIVCKLAFKSEWKLKNSGIILTHLGVLVLLIGGLFTAFTQEEGYLYIPEGQSQNKISDYHRRVMIIADEENILHFLDIEDLNDGQILNLKGVPLSINVLEACSNCKIIKAEDDPSLDSLDEDVTLFGPAQFMSIKEKELEKENETNIAGIRIEIQEEGQAGRYVTNFFEGFTKPVEYKSADKTYYFGVTREKRDLPFSVQLIDFEKEVYPGTQKAKEYRSHVIIRDDEKDLEWPATISMNEPARYKGYTLYQSSFDDTGQVEATVLSAVKNEGWLFPYISTLIFILGLVLHMFIQSRGRV
tara:strand:- start:295 stop:1416 length:1122 start_codon:yes stop_codon:yes gene_type:complete